MVLTIAALISMRAAQAQSLLGNSFDGVLYDVNVTTGAATNPRSTGTGIDSLTGITFAPNGTLYGLTSFVGTPANSLVTIDPLTGLSTSIGFTGLAIAEGDLAFDRASGVLYGMQHVPSNRQLFTMNIATGAGTVVGDLGGSETIEPSAMAFAPDGTLYILDTGSILGDGTKLPTRLLTVDKSTAATLTAVTLPVNLGFTAGMDFHPTTGALYVADGGLGDGTDSLYTVDPNTGAMMLVGPTGLVDGLAGLVFAIPEPSSAALASLAGLIALAMRRSLS
jgi:hypothetical protein